MAIMAQWLSKKWEVSSSKITALTSISTGLTLEAERNDDADGSAATNIRGYEPRSLPLTMKYGVAAGTKDPRAEYESWEALVGAYGPFYLSGKRFGAKNYLLASVKAQDIVLSNTGAWIECRVSATLEEYTEEAAGKKSKASTGSGSSSSGKSKLSLAPAIAAATSKSAANIGPSTADKAAHKVAAL